MLDVICVGSATVDAFLTVPESSDYFRRNAETNEICMLAGQKIPLENCEFHLGGNANNVSVGLARLHYKVALMAEVGNDTYGRMIKQELHDEGVTTTRLVLRNNEITAFAMGLNFKGDRTLFVQHPKRHNDFTYEDIKTKWFYLTSLGESWRHAYRSVVAFAKENDVCIAFNPGTLQLEEGADDFDNVLAATTIIFLNKEEAMKITGIKSITSTTGTTSKEFIEKLMLRLQEMGPKIVVVTDGDNGSYALDSEKTLHHQAIVRTHVVEKTGAGDSYATGFLGGYLAGKDIPTCMQWGAVNSASVVAHVGAQPGMLRRSTLERKVAEL